MHEATLLICFLLFKNTQTDKKRIHIKRLYSDACECVLLWD